MLLARVALSFIPTKASIILARHQKNNDFVDVARTPSSADFGLVREDRAPNEHNETCSAEILVRQASNLRGRHEDNNSG